MKRRTYFDAEPWYQREKTTDWYQQMEKTNEAFKKILRKNLDKNSLVLEIACGGGGIAEYVLSLGVGNYLGYDFAETAVNNTLERLKQFSNADVKRGNALDPYIYRGPFNVIIAHQFFHCLIGKHRKDWLELCSSLILKNGGTFILSSMIGLPDSLKQTVDPQTRINVPGNRYYAEDGEIQEELKNSGFEIVEAVYPEDNSAIYLCAGVNPALKKCS